MSPDLTLALQISLIGMSLVFAAIVLLWAGMALLVRVAPEREMPVIPPAASPEVLAGQGARRRRAAAAAVAVLLAQAAEVPPLPPTAIVSAWQAVTRANQLRQRGPTR
jgi:hypothetical protein